MTKYRWRDIQPFEKREDYTAFLMALAMAVLSIGFMVLLCGVATRMLVP